MNKTILEQFDSGLNELTDFYRANPFVDLKKIRPKLDGLCQLVEADPVHRDDYLTRFLRVVDGMKTARARSNITRNAHLLDFCMRRLKWPEIGQALKAGYASVVDADARLETEALIKRIYDPAWEGGEFEFLAPDENIWE
ncbi:MAG: hypothetical protein ABI073_03220 [Luteolibacter sp.]